jgi:hypothetical protein
MNTAKADIEAIQKKLSAQKAFLEDYLEICDKHQLDFNYDDTGALSVDPIPVNEDFMSLRLFAEYMLEELNEEQNPS